MKTIERIRQYIDKKGFSYAEFERICGLSNGYIGKQIKRNADIGEGILTQIIENSPDISREWLYFGEGSMFRPIGLMDEAEIAAQDADKRFQSGEAVPSAVINHPSYQNLLNKVQELAAEIDDLKTENNRLNIELKDAYKEISTLQKELRNAEKQ
jgi:transcriptional regulator with XRE-family HTH domain